MATTFFRRLAKATPASFNNTFEGQPKSGFAGFRFSAISTNYCLSEPNFVHLDEINEEAGPKVALKSDKWLEFKLQDTARVSHNTHLFRFSFDPTAKLGLDFASCILTSAPLGQDAEGKTKFVIRPLVQDITILLVENQVCGPPGMMEHISGANRHTQRTRIH